MCGFPGSEGGQLTEFARHMHEIWGTTSIEETIRIRREEDRHAAGLVGAKAVHFDFLDCIYRRGLNGEALYLSEVFVPPHQQESDLPAQLGQTISRWMQSDDIVVCPLGIGGHVDHVLVRQAAEMAIRTSPHQRQMVYVADIPYLLNHPDELAPITAGMSPVLHPVSEVGLDSWMQAIEAYASQQSSLFDSPTSMRVLIRGYWSETQGVRLWTAKPMDSRIPGAYIGPGNISPTGLDSPQKP